MVAGYAMNAKVMAAPILMIFSRAAIVTDLAKVNFVKVVQKERMNKCDSRSGKRSSGFRSAGIG